MTLPLVVVALGGNAISPPRGELSFAGERAAIDGAAAELAAIARGGACLLIDGNGPQVGRLLAASGIGDSESLFRSMRATQALSG